MLHKCSNGSERGQVQLKWYDAKFMIILYSAKHTQMIKALACRSPYVDPKLWAKAIGERIESYDLLNTILHISWQYSVGKTGNLSHDKTTVMDFDSAKWSAFKCIISSQNLASGRREMVRLFCDCAELCWNGYMAIDPGTCIKHKKMELYV